MVQVPRRNNRRHHHMDLVERVPEPGPSYADVSEQLLMEFGPVHGLRRVSELLQRCRAQLATVPVRTPRDLERLARAALGDPAAHLPRQVAR